MNALFRNADFRRLFLGRLVTNAGDSLYSIAAMWLVYSLSGSTLYTGLAGFLTMGPQMLQVFVGPLVDRWAIRRVLVVTQALQGVLVLTIPAAHWLGVLSAPLVLVVMPIVAMLNQFVYPAQSAVLPRLVETEQLTAANSAFSFAYQGAELVFNALAGLLVAAVGAVSLYLLDSITFALAVGLFAGLRIPPAEKNGDDDERGYLAELRGGLGFVRGTVIVPLMGAGLVANALLGATLAVLPAFADAHGGPGIYGLLMAAVAGGGLLGALVASKLDGIPYGRLSMGGFAASALAWFAALSVGSMPATVALFGLAFVPVGVSNVVGMTLMQRLVPDDLLGRVTALLGSASTAVMPFGSLLGGAAGDTFGVEIVMVAGGLGLLWIVVYVAAIPSLRRMPAPIKVETIGRPGAESDEESASDSDEMSDSESDGESASRDIAGAD